MVTHRGVYDIAKLLGIGDPPKELVELAKHWTASAGWDHERKSHHGNKEYVVVRLAYLEWLEPHFRMVQLMTAHLVTERSLKRELETLRRMKRLEERWNALKWFKRSTLD